MYDFAIPFTVDRPGIGLGEGRKICSTLPSGLMISGYRLVNGFL